MSHHEVRVLCRPESAAGFALAGLAPVIAASPEQAAASFRELWSLAATGVLLVGERLWRELPEELQREASRRPLPLVVPCPEPEWGAGRAAAEELIIELLRRAIGYRVRLR